MKPTKEQQFWERCGLRLINLPDRGGEQWVDAEGRLIYLDKHLPIDLNNLFKYAVPKLEGGIDIAFSKFEDTGWFVRLENQVMTTKDETPALALFWAIYKALGGKE